jgi:predicted polyphosphate/ATP-dependent NAD kinase
LILKRIGFIVNPIAGMGGAIGLKGTDGDAISKAIELGAKPVAPHQTKRFLEGIKDKNSFVFFIPPGLMGETYIKSFDFRHQVLGTISEPTSAEDTKNVASLMEQEGIDLLIFIGGDGTARDIYEAIDMKVPVIAIPAGVKMFSAVFSVNVEAAIEIFSHFLNDRFTLEEREVLDIDETSYRNNILKSQLYGYLKTVSIPGLVQFAKGESLRGDSLEMNKKDIAQFVIEFMNDNVVYLLGPGTTVKAITDELGLPKTLLGVDALFNKRLIGRDMNEKMILNLIAKHHHIKIIVTPIGGQGFIFGRGNKQFTPSILKKVGIKNIIIISTEQKLQELEFLHIDSNDHEVDESYRGLVLVITGYKEEKIMKLI